MIRRVLPLAVVLGLCLGGVEAAEPLAEATLADGQRIEAASLLSLEFRDGLREATLLVDRRKTDAPGLTRWGEPAAPTGRPTVWLADDSWITTDRGWSPLGLVRVDDKTVRLRHGDGWVEAPRSAVRAVTFSAPDENELTEPVGESVLLTAGDRLAGLVESVDTEGLTLRVAGEPLATPLDRVAAIWFDDQEDRPVDSRGLCLVGLDNGSLLKARELTVADDSFRIVMASGVEVSGAAASIALVQPLGGPVRYLSDLEPVDYRHTPYLDLEWPYERDRGLRGSVFQGGGLVGGGRRAAKGLALHSAARLVYRLDGRYSRFRADLAVADRPADSTPGSVVFRAYLVKDGKFEAALETDVVRGGDPAIPIDVDLTGAAALALVVDYADDGDAGDDALWLDARLVDGG